VIELPKHVPGRKADWEYQLHMFFLDTMDGRELDWLNDHCVSWTGRAVAMMTGTDYIGQLELDAVNSPAQALKTLKRMGLESLEEGVAAMFQEVPLMYATRGDICLVRGGVGANEAALAICDPPVFYCLQPEGLAKGLMTEAFRAFKV